MPKKMNTSQLAIDELFVLIRHAAREIILVDQDNCEKNRDTIMSHTSRIENLVEALDEREQIELEALKNERS